MTEAAATPTQPDRRQLTLDWLAFAAILLAIAISQRAGNFVGVDDYPMLFAGQQTTVEWANNRPLHMWLITLTHPIIGMHPLWSLPLLLLHRWVNAVLFYQLLRLMLPEQSSLARLAAYTYATFMPADGYLMLTFQLSSLPLSAATLAMAAFAAWFTYLRRGKRPLWLVTALALCAASILTYEGGLPLLAVIPAAEALTSRWAARRSGRRESLPWIPLGLWMIVVGGLGVRFFLTSILNPDSYATRVTASTEAGMLIFNAAYQFGLAFVPHLGWGGGVDGTGWMAFLAGASACAGALTLRRASPFNDGSDNRRSLGRAGLLALLAGLGVALLGFLPFLPTIYGQAIHRVHLYAAAGEALALAGAIWYVSHMLAGPQARLTLQASALVLIAAISASHVNTLQQNLSGPGFSWEANAQFRGLAAQVPAAEANTLLYFFMPGELGCPPVVAVREFEAGVRYLWEEALYSGGRESQEMRGIVSESGIIIAANGPRAARAQIVRESSHHWNEVIIVAAAPDCDSLRILAELPDGFAPDGTAAAYKPFERIRSAWLPRRVLALLPPVQEPGEEEVRSD